ncbi:MAG TPA: polysaccharide biosynthesis/export family protein [Gemmatimonadaceae bacterium]|nr:polysaccharide biosynthesis/export family protein [Gemmatimonadaceae bacterium]
MLHLRSLRSARLRAALSRAAAGGVALALAATAPSTAASQAHTTATADTSDSLAAPSLSTVRAGAPAAGRDVGSPGDSLRLTIWREPDLSRSYWIDESGFVNLPKIGQVQAAGVPSDELKSRIVAAYQTYLTHSSIDVAILHRVQVRGAVRSPGIYFVNQTMSLGDALALAGGSTAEGEPDKAQLLRQGERLRGATVAGTRIGQTTLRSGDQIYVPERSWSQRNMAFLATALGASVSVLVAFLYKH